MKSKNHNHNKNNNPITRSRARHENDLEERLNRRSFQQIVTKTESKHLIKRPFVKPLVGTIGQLDIIAYDKNKKPLMLAKIQRRKPNPISFRAIPLRKNPNKIDIYKISNRYMGGLSVFAYKGNNTYIYISNHGSFVDIPTESARAMCEAILKYLESIGQ
jgi:hypothetical protein